VDGSGKRSSRSMVTLLIPKTGRHTIENGQLGKFEYPALPGELPHQISHPGFQKMVIDGLRMEVGSIVSRKSSHARQVSERFR